MDNRTLGLGYTHKVWVENKNNISCIYTTVFLQIKSTFLYIAIKTKQIKRKQNKILNLNFHRNI